MPLTMIYVESTLWEAFVYECGVHNRDVTGTLQTLLRGRIGQWHTDDARQRLQEQAKVLRAQEDA